jgi:hypothetical protein
VVLEKEGRSMMVRSHAASFPGNPLVGLAALGACAAGDVACAAEANALAAGVELDCQPQTIYWPGGSRTEVQCAIPGSDNYAFSANIIAQPGGGAVVAADIGRSQGEFEQAREIVQLPNFEAYNAAIAAGVANPSQSLITYAAAPAPGPSPALPQEAASAASGLPNQSIPPRPQPGEVPATPGVTTADRLAAGSGSGAEEPSGFAAIPPMVWVAIAAGAFLLMNRGQTGRR